MVRAADGHLIVDTGIPSKICNNNLAQNRITHNHSIENHSEKWFAEFFLLLRAGLF